MADREQDDGATWYKDAVIYELHVRAFADSDGDGIGDFRGLTGKLDYLRDLGVNALWLLPFYPSPLRDDGYDIADYTAIHPAYGTMRDFKDFLKAAHARGLRVDHRAGAQPHLGPAPLVPARAARPARHPLARFYVWSDDPDRYGAARVIFRDADGPDSATLPVEPPATEQTNTSLRLGDRWVLKLFRRLDTGANPARTIGQYLTRRGAAFAPSLDGYLQYVPGRGEARDLGILQRFVPHDSTARQRLQAAARRSSARAAARAPTPALAVDARALLDLAVREPGPEATGLLGDALEVAAALGARNAELHRLLAEARDDPQLVPRPVTPFHLRAPYQALRSLTGRVFAALRAARGALDPSLREQAKQLLTCEGHILQRFEAIRSRPLGGLRTRYHGNYHLGQLLATADGWAIIDFEGEVPRPLYEREIKQSPLGDVTSMLGSIYTVGLLAGESRRGDARPARPARARWERAWLAGLAGAFLRAYLDEAEPGGFLPREGDDCALLLDVLLLERAVYELGYALDAHPGRLGVPLSGLLHLLDQPGRGR